MRNLLSPSDRDTKRGSVRKFARQCNADAERMRKEAAKRAAEEAARERPAR